MAAVQGMMDASRTVFMLCDVQEKFQPAISHFNELVLSCKKLIKVGQLLNIPLLVTEQYPAKLGSTVGDLTVSHAAYVEAKTQFSMVTDTFRTTMEKMFGKPNDDTVCVIMGLETHVCVEQTVAQLLRLGYSVHVAADAVSSRSQEDRLLAFKRLSQMGCFVSSSESIIFKLVGDAKHPKFKEISALVKPLTPQTGLANL